MAFSVVAVWGRTPWTGTYRILRTSKNSTLSVSGSGVKENLTPVNRNVTIRRYQATNVSSCKPQNFNKLPQATEFRISSFVNELFACASRVNVLITSYLAALRSKSTMQSSDIGSSMCSASINFAPLGSALVRATLRIRSWGRARRSLASSDPHQQVGCRGIQLRDISGLPAKLWRWRKLRSLPRARWSSCISRAFMMLAHIGRALGSDRCTQLTIVNSRQFSAGRSM